MSARKLLRVVGSACWFAAFIAILGAKGPLETQPKEFIIRASIWSGGLFLWGLVELLTKAWARWKIVSGVIAALSVIFLTPLIGRLIENYWKGTSSDIYAILLHLLALFLIFITIMEWRGGSKKNARRKKARQDSAEARPLQELLKTEEADY